MPRRGNYPLTRNSHDDGWNSWERTTTCCFGVEMFRKKQPPSSECHLPTEKCSSALGVECGNEEPLPINTYPRGEPPPVYSPPSGSFRQRQTAASIGAQWLASQRASVASTADVQVELTSVRDKDIVVEEQPADQGQSRPTLPSKGPRQTQNATRTALIIDQYTGATYQRGKLLGKGGFARCYELTDTRTNVVYAGKIISKTRLSKPRQKDKILREVELHQNLHHANIVDFHSFFEDDLSMYIILENCSRKSLIHILKLRKTLTEPEVRYFMQQLVEGCRYIHSKKIVHRDLKLGNMLLNEQMQLKIADFGLATRIDYEGEKKMTVCGTPNYIAPEVLQKHGHSYEADVWALGCIMYTLLVGLPPFETTTLSETYYRITNNVFTVPGCVSLPAKDLITKLLSADPLARPLLDQIFCEEFFTSGYMPKLLPTSCCDSAPTFPAHNVRARKAYSYAAPTSSAVDESDAIGSFVRQGARRPKRVPSQKPASNNENFSSAVQSFASNELQPKTLKLQAAVRQTNPPNISPTENTRLQTPKQNEIKIERTSSQSTPQYAGSPRNKIEHTSGKSTAEHAPRSKIERTCSQTTTEHIPRRSGPASVSRPRHPSAASSALKGRSPQQGVTSRDVSPMGAGAARIAGASEQQRNDGGATSSLKRSTSLPPKQRIKPTFSEPPSQQSHKQVVEVSPKYVESAKPGSVQKRRQPTASSTPSNQNEPYICDSYQRSCTKPGKSQEEPFVSETYPPLLKTPQTAERNKSSHETPKSSPVDEIPEKKLDHRSRSLKDTKVMENGKASDGKRVESELMHTEKLIAEGKAFSAIRLYKMLTHCLEVLPADSFPTPVELCKPLWVTKWVDYSNKYGFGFQFSDRSVGILFNDTTRMVLSTDGKTLVYNDLSNKTYLLSTDSAPDEYRKKVTLLLYFSQYMEEHLIQGMDFIHNPYGHASAVFIKKWFRTDRAIVMHLSNGTLQVNFFDDHTKLILSVDGQDYLVTYIDSERQSVSYRLLQLQHFGCSNAIAERLKYARKMLEGIINFGGQAV